MRISQAFLALAATTVLMTGCGDKKPATNAVTQAVKSVDPQAAVKVDLATGQVDVQSQQDPAAIARAIEEEGYKVAA